MFKTLSDIFDGETITMNVESYYERKVTSHIARTPYAPESTYKFEFSAYDEELDDAGTFAFLILKVQEYANIENAVEYADYKGGDEYPTVEYARDFLRKNQNYYKAVLEQDECITICEMHNLYVSPKHRGKGISEAIKLMLPALLMENGYSSAVITTYINPFVRQTDITEHTETSADGFGGYVDKDKEVDPTLHKIMDKSLKRCGFMDMGNRYYATTSDDLLALAEDVLDSFQSYPYYPPYYEEE